MVVRVVVTALESAPSDTEESSDSSRKHKGHILKPIPGRRVEGSSGWEVSENEVKIHMNYKNLRPRILIAEQA